jgi:pyruvyl transferase EpsO
MIAASPNGHLRPEDKFGMKSGTMMHESIFLGLKQRLAGITHHIPGGARAILVDYPLHANIGDLLIHLGEERFFEAHGIEVTARYSRHDYSRPATLRPDDVFFFHGGGNCGDLYPEHRVLLEHIVEENQDHQIIVCPQTVHFVHNATYLETCRILRNHRSLIFYARDRSSYDLMVAGGLSQVHMMPDMAHQLIGDLGQLNSPARSEPNYILRRDIESRDGLGTSRPNAMNSIDWNGGVRLSNKILVELFFRLARAHGDRFLNPVIQNLWIRIRDRVIEDGKRLISGAPVTYTDRLHVMILCGLLGRPVHFYDNSYGKLRNYYETWLVDDPLITFEDLREAGQTTETIVANLGGFGVCELPS